ncbi:hypothetical protein C0J52_24245, partial [Blattella germanica]
VFNIVVVGGLLHHTAFHHPRFHLSLSFQSSSVIYLSSMFCFTLSFHESHGLPLFFLRGGIKLYIFNGHPSVDILLRCPYQVRRLPSIMSMMFMEDTCIRSLMLWFRFLSSLESLQLRLQRSISIAFSLFSLLFGISRNSAP